MNRKKLEKLIIIICFLFIFSGCIPYRKLVPLDGQKDNPLVTDSLFKYNYEAYRLHNYDIIDVQIYSPNAEASKYFSKTFSGGSSQIRTMSGGDIYYMTGYGLDYNGMINLPILGDIEAAGKTLLELKSDLEDELSKYFKKDFFYITVKLGGIKYTVNGEVNGPGTFIVLQNQVTLIQAITSAGDFKTWANRKEVIILRQYPDGTKAHKVNLLDQEILASEFYFIQPNDIIQVKPMKAKVLGFGEGVFSNVTGIATLTISLLILLTR